MRTGVRTTFRPALVVFCLAAVFHFLPGDIRAQTSERVNVKGLKVELAGDWVQNPGYRPLRVTIRPSGALSVDRRLAIVVTANVGWTNQGPIVVEEDILVPAGATLVERSVSIPCMNAYQNYSIVLLEDGVRLKTKRPIVLQAQQPGYPGIPEQTPCVLFVGKQTPDTTALAKYYGAAAHNRRYGWYAAPSLPGPGPMTVTPVPSPPSPPSSGPAAVPPMPGSLTLAPAELPVRWIDYTCFDIACLSLDELRDLRAKHADAAGALIAWARAGGTLWVYGAGSAARRNELSDLLEGRAPSRPLDQSAYHGRDGARPSSGAWEEPDKADFGKCPSWIVWADKKTVNVHDQQYGDPAEIKALWAWSRKAPKLPREPAFRLRDLGFGRVIALDADQPFPGDPWQWGWIVDAMDERENWSDRYGLSYSAANPDFWNFLVPGVGLAPVTQFQVLISLFVLLIGPVNYMLLRRRKRLHLLLLTIPAGAIAVTGLLVGYAMIADGLAVRVRTRSVTRIDQRSGQSVCWARLSYYAGLSPRGGLRFSDDVAVLPYSADDEDAYHAPRYVVWAGGQRLTQGWLPSRTPTQYFTVRSRATERRLRIARPATGVAGLTVENRLGAPIRMLAVGAHDGKLYWSTEVASKATAVAAQVREDAVVAALGRILRDNAPAPPPGVNPVSGSASGIASVFSPQYHYLRGWQPSYPSSGVSLMETSLAAACGPGGIRPGQYVAVLGAQPELELGTSSAREEGSFHVVLGEW